MNGVTVLNTYSSVEPELAPIIILFVIAILFLMFSAFEFKVKDFCGGITLLIIGVVLSLISIYLYSNRETNTHYDALIDDSVSFNSIYEQYKIDGKDGDIYHLTLRSEVIQSDQ